MRILDLFSAYLYIYVCCIDAKTKEVTGLWTNCKQVLASMNNNGFGDATGTTDSSRFQSISNVLVCDFRDVKKRRSTNFKAMEV